MKEKHNEYKASLNKYRTLISEENTLQKQWITTRGRGPPIEEIIVFLYHLNESWPEMYALEQRDFCYNQMGYWTGILNSKRKETISLWDDEFIGILGEHVRRKGLFSAQPLEDSVHDSHQTLTLNELENMAKAVESLDERRNIK